MLLTGGTVHDCWDIFTPKVGEQAKQGKDLVKLSQAGIGDKGWTMLHHICHPYRAGAHSQAIPLLSTVLAYSLLPNGKYEVVSSLKGECRMLHPRNQSLICECLADDSPSGVQWTKRKLEVEILTADWELGERQHYAENFHSG